MRNDVARTSDRTAHGSVGRVHDTNATEAIAQFLHPGDIGADEVTLDDVIRLELAGYSDTVLSIGGNNITRRGGSSTDQVIANGGGIAKASDVHSAITVAQRLGASHIHANEIALNNVAERAKGDLDPGV